MFNLPQDPSRKPRGPSGEIGDPSLWRVQWTMVHLEHRIVKKEEELQRTNGSTTQKEEEKAAPLPRTMEEQNRIDAANADNHCNSSLEPEAGYLQKNLPIKSRASVQQQTSLTATNGNTSPRGPYGLGLSRTSMHESTKPPVNPDVQKHPPA